MKLDEQLNGLMNARDYIIANTAPNPDADVRLMIDALNESIFDVTCIITRNTDPNECTDPDSSLLM